MNPTNLRDKGIAMPCIELAQSVLAVHYMVPRYPADRQPYALCAGCEWTEPFSAIGAARKRHGAHVLDVLNANDIEVTEADGHVYAAAAADSDGTIRPVSRAFGTRSEAEDDLATLRGDDYYRDRQPFVATAIAQTWRPIEPD